MIIKQQGRQTQAKTLPAHHIDGTASRREGSRAGVPCVSNSGDFIVISGFNGFVKVQWSVTPYQEKGKTVRAVVQRVKESAVSVAGTEVGRIGSGFVVFLGIGADDTGADLDYLVSKIVHLRAFEDAEGKMNLDLRAAGGEMLVVSQFTLLADCRKGRRPSFTDAAPPDIAQQYYDEFIARVQHLGIRVAAGIFQAHMNVWIVNDGPVTFLLDSKKLF